MNYEFKQDLIFVTDEWLFTLDYLQEIVNDAAFTTSKNMTMKFVHCSSSKSTDNYKYPSIRVPSQSVAEQVQLGLFDLGIPADIDLYEDDDGDGDGGRPIIRKIWSVTIPSIILRDTDLVIPDRIESTELMIECSADLDNAMYNESI